jgi:hypothetical protein
MKKLPFLLLAVLLAVGSGMAFTDDDGFRNIRLRLTGYEEAPVVISTVGNGRFFAKIDTDTNQIEWELRYADLEGAVQQAHIHFGSPNVVGGISVFLCTNLGNGPAGTQLCPASPARVTGVAMAADVIGPLAQGIEPGAFEELLAAIRAGRTYVNVHSAKWPAGEIRSQIPGRDDDHRH